MWHRDALFLDFSEVAEYVNEPPQSYTAASHAIRSSTIAGGHGRFVFVFMSCLLIVIRTFFSLACLVVCCMLLWLALNGVFNSMN